MFLLTCAAVWLTDVYLNLLIIKYHQTLTPDDQNCIHSVLSLSLYRPGVLKDLKTMGSVSLFIFFITLLVLARQVSSLLNWPPQ